MPQTVSQYKRAFQRSKGESESSARLRMSARIQILLKEGKLVQDSYPKKKLKDMSRDQAKQLVNPYEEWRNLTVAEYIRQVKARERGGNVNKAETIVNMWKRKLKQWDEGHGFPSATEYTPRSETQQSGTAPE